MNKRRIVIVGGGLAGLAAAETLAMSLPLERFSIELVESKRVTGGRAGSFDAGAGGTVDYCQHVTMGCCTRMLGLMRRSGLQSQWRQTRELQFVHPDHSPSRFAPSRWLPPPLHLAATVTAMNYLNRTQRWRLRAGLFCLMRQTTASLQHQTAGDWLRRHGQTEPIRNRFWQPVLVSALGESVEVVSMAAARKVIIDGFAVARGAADVWVPMLPLSEMFGRRLTDHVRQLGVDIQTSTSAEKISLAGGLNHSLSVDSPRKDWPSKPLSSFEIQRSGQSTTRADHVVLATPWHRWSKILDDSLHRSVAGLAEIANVAASPITGLHLWWDRPMLKIPQVVMLGGIADWAFASPTVSSDPGYVQIVISGPGPHRTIGRRQLVDQVAAELRSLDSSVAHDGASAAVLEQVREVTDPHSVYSLTPAIDRLRPPTRTGTPGLYLAGDFVQTGWPATMEGAVISGHLAAEAICEAESIPAAAMPPDLPTGWLSRLAIRR